MTRALILGLSCILPFVAGCQEEKQQETPASHSARFQEPHRPQLHFSPAANWTNDPNGMVFFEGEYHLFYQYYPDSTVWGPMHWGHAVSPDLVHWEHLPIALYPDSLGYIFSGSAVVDWNNSTGFGTTESPAMVAMFTYHDPIGAQANTGTYQTQGIAYSLDRGRTWTKYEANPVIQNPGIPDFRDPKVIWDKTNQQWIVALAVQDHTSFYTSQDLKSWSHLSDFGYEFGDHDGVWECPDFFPIQVTGTEETKWVLLLSINPGGPNGGSATQYFVGDFDGKTFSLDPEFAQNVQNNQGVWVDYGKDNYAGVTWSDVPTTDGRRIFLGWMSNWQYANVVPTQAWRNAMTIPRELTLHKLSQGYRLFSAPVKEVELIQGESTSIDNAASMVTGSILHQTTADGSSGMRIALTFAATPDGMVGIELSNAKGETMRMGFDPASNQFFSDRRKSGDLGFSANFAPGIDYAPRVASTEAPISMDILIDVSSIELFADQGATVMTSIFFPTEPFSTVTLISENGSHLASATISALSSIW